MTAIYPKTRQQQYYIELYNRSTTHTIYNAYKKPSQNKIDVYNSLLKMEYEAGGMYGKIISHNTFKFTYAFKYWKELERNIGTIEILRVITPTRIFDIELQIEF